jgi:hypothetical protein
VRLLEIEGDRMNRRTHPETPPLAGARRTRAHNKETALAILAFALLLLNGPIHAGLCRWLGL